MSFEVYGATNSAKSNDAPKVDYDALNKYVVETCQLEDRQTLPGYVSAIIDLGTQKMPDAEYKFEGNEDDEAEAIAEKPGTYFKDGFDDNGKPCRLKCWPREPQQCVAIAVDFPEIMLDKGKFFGNSNPKPLRMYLGGQFYTQENGMVVARPTPLKVTNLDKTRKTKKFSFAMNSIFYKMAVAAKLIKAGDVFLPNDIDKLLGQAFQFSVQVHFKESKGKQYFTEYINFVGALARGQAVPELVTTPVLVQFNKKNDEEALKELRWHVVNTMKRANNWENSLIKKQIESLKGDQQEQDTHQDDSAPEQEEKPTKKAPAKKAEPEPNFDDLDDDLLPF